LQRLFATFPAGRPGIGLLLLRSVLGLTLLFQAGAYLNDWHNLNLETLAALAVTCVGGLSLLAGILTPVISLMVLLVGIGYALMWIAPPAPNMFESKLVITNVIAVAAAIFFLGPGAFSLDARLFGRREIFIPNPQHSAKS